MRPYETHEIFYMSLIFYSYYVFLRLIYGSESKVLVLS
jgi:hypothetical protein